MSSPNLVSIYTGILGSGWMIPNERDEVVQRISSETEEVIPLLIENRIVALPTRENLNRSGKDNLIIFHPLMEGLIGGASPVIGKIRRVYSIRLNAIIGEALRSLLSGATSTLEVAKFSPDQLELLTVLTKVDEKTLKAWDKIVNLSIEQFNVGNFLVDVYMKPNAVMSGQTYSRVAFVKFPLYEELKKPEGKIFGSSTKFRSTDIEMFIKLFEFVFPNIAVENAYSYGTNSRIAPFLDALLGCFGKLFKLVNGVYNNFNNVIPMDAAIVTDLDWQQYFRDIETLTSIASSVPQQYGNFAVKTEDRVREQTGSSDQRIDNLATSSGPTMVELGSQQSPLAKAQAPQQSNSQRILDTPKRVGLGMALSSSYEEEPKKVDLSANIITNAEQSGNFGDPFKAIQHEIRTIKESGGIPTVSLGSSFSTQQSNNGNVNPVTGNPYGNNNNGGNFGGANNNGWVTNNNNGSNFGQPQLSPMAMLEQEAMRRMLNGDGGFNNGGSRSII